MGRLHRHSHSVHELEMYNSFSSLVIIAKLLSLYAVVFDWRNNYHRHLLLCVKKTSPQRKKKSSQLKESKSIKKEDKSIKKEDKPMKEEDMPTKKDNSYKGCA